MYDRAYHEANRERINQKHRENYLKHREERNARRRAEYQLQRERILQKQKEDRAPCPLCERRETGVPTGRTRVLRTRGVVGVGVRAHCVPTERTSLAWQLRATRAPPSAPAVV